MRLDCGCRKGLSFDRVFIKPKRSALPSRNLVIERTFRFKHSGNVWTGVPIIAANMDHTGTVDMLNALNGYNAMTALHKFHGLEDMLDVVNDGRSYNMWYSIGMCENDFNQLDTFSFLIKQANAQYRPNICIDVANGYTEKFVEFVATVREKYPNSTIMAGNVASYEMTEQLILSGADIVKVGIGPGSVCTTRRMTGVGAPQLSAIDECADAAHGLGGMICADGGCRHPGDIAKAYAAGADFVMLGGMLAGHDECDGELIYDDAGPLSETIVENPNFDPEKKNRYIRGFIENVPIGMKFHGMSSKEAQEEHYGGVRSYRAAEGKEVVVPYRGSVQDTFQEILGGLRSTMTYIGAWRLKDIPKCATLVLTNEQLNGSFE